MMIYKYLLLQKKSWLEIPGHCEKQILMLQKKRPQIMTKRQLNMTSNQLEKCSPVLSFEIRMASSYGIFEAISGLHQERIYPQQLHLNVSNLQSGGG
jgi:hypothetical protein